MNTRRSFIQLLAGAPLALFAGVRAAAAWDLEQSSTLRVADLPLHDHPLFPSGTRMAFQQTKAPRGWNKTGKAVANFRRVSGIVCEKV